MTALVLDPLVLIVDPLLVGCDCCPTDRPCRALRRLWAELEAGNARLRQLAALLPEDVDWLLAHGWDGS